MFRPRVGATPGGATATRSASVNARMLRVKLSFFFFQAEDGIRDYKVTGVQTCALPILVYAGIVALIAVRILWLAAFGDHAGRKEGLTTLVPERGDIVDRDGEPLARTKIGRASCRERV